MLRLFNRAKKERFPRKPCAICESLEDRRLLSAAGHSAGLKLHRAAPLSTVQGDMIGSVEVATVSGPAITAFNDNWKGPGIGIGGPSLQASVRWGSGKPVEGYFVTTDSQDTLQIYSGNTLIGPGVHPLHITIQNNGKTVASLSENITVLPRSDFGVALHAVAGQPFSGTVGYIPQQLEAGQLLSVNWGDQTIDPASTQVIPWITEGFAVQSTHTYAHPGNYVIEVVLENQGSLNGADYFRTVIVSTITVSRS